jgi:integrase
MRRHAGSQRARVRINGKTHWLGPWVGRTPSPEAQKKFDELLAQWQQGRFSRSPVPPVTLVDVGPNRPVTVTPAQPPKLSVAELVAAYIEYAKTYYQTSSGKPSSTLDNIRQAARALGPYLHTPAEDFGPLKLTHIMEQLAAEQRLRRKTINSIANTIRRIFRWGCSREMLPGRVREALNTAEPLKLGRTPAPESPPVLPVADEIVETTLPHLPQAIRDMVQFERLTGARPGEVCNLTVSDIDMRGEVWSALLVEHKTAYIGKRREILIGPRAQGIIRPYLNRHKDAAVFSPRDSEKIRRKEQRRERKTKLYPSHVTHMNRKRKAKPKRTAGEFYSTDSYRRAIRRACEKAGIEPWTPNQLRHSAGTELRRRFGLEAAQVVLGHQSADITEIYAERDRELAVKVMKELG